MREVSREWLEFLREQYPKGSRVRLTKMGNDPHPIPPGSMGTLKYIDDVGQFHVKWDNGRGLALIIGEDQFQILPPEPQTIKFYMPLTAQLYAYDDWGDLEEYGNDLDGSELRDYQSCIHEALLENQMPEEKNRGLMHWYDKPDGVNTKVQSVMLDVESRDGQLWGVAECKVNGTLLPEEKEALAEYISGQASDGWGEGFEQRAIKLNDGELYRYILDPYALEWKNDHYYLIGYSHKHKGIAHFRVDRLTSVEPLDSKFQPMPDFDVAAYTNKMVDMFAAEHTEQVKLLCSNELMRVIIDHYGEDIEISPYDDTHFTVIIEVNPSGTFYGWVFKFMGKIRILSPQSCVDKMQDIARTFI